MTQNTDIVIIGAGIVGSNISYLLKKHNIEHILLEQSNALFDNASGCAGAFVTPNIGKESDIKSLLDDAFIFSTAFYDSFDDIAAIKGSISLVQQYNATHEQLTPHKHKKISTYNQKGYLFKDAITINPLKLAKELIKNTTIKYDYKVKTLQQNNKQWLINNEIITNKVILATGHSTSLINEPYINITGVYGTKIDITSSTQIPMAINKEIYFSKSINNQFSIGATHHRINDTKDISTQQDIDYLLNKIQQILPIQDIKVQNIKQGIRACSKDYFPLVGNIIDGKKSIEKFPQIKHGTHIPKDMLITKDNLFICNGVGAKGFTLAPYIANILVSHILEKSPIPDKLTLYKRFVRYYRKNAG